MADVVDRVKRSQMMAGIRGKNTKPEKTIRTALHAAGFRYRTHVPDLPGKPDLVFPKYKAVVLVHGCFWHRHRDCRWCTQPSSNETFWSTKFEENVRRDQRNISELEALGWRIAVVWECALRLQGTALVIESLGKWLIGSTSRLTLPSDQEKRLVPLSEEKETAQSRATHRNQRGHAKSERRKE